MWRKAIQALTAEDAEDAEEEREKWGNGPLYRKQPINVSLGHRSGAPQATLSKDSILVPLCVLCVLRGERFYEDALATMTLSRNPLQSNLRPTRKSDESYLPTSRYRTIANMQYPLPVFDPV